MALVNNRLGLLVNSRGTPTNGAIKSGPESMLGCTRVVRMFKLNLSPLCEVAFLLKSAAKGAASMKLFKLALSDQLQDTVIR